MPIMRECPFCGGAVKAREGFMGLVFVRCRKCGATVSFDNDECNRGPWKALEYFNRRVNEYER